MSFESLEDIFYSIKYENLNLRTFEEWLYSEDNLEEVLGVEEYLELISMNYQKKGARYDLEHLLEKNVDLGLIETRYILGLLESCYVINEKTFDSLCRIYDLYCKGYYFMRKMALEYGLWCEVPHSEEHAKGWMNIHDSSYNTIIRDKIPEIKKASRLLIDVISSGEVVLTGNMTTHGNREYIDNRTDEAKRLTDID